MQRSSHEAALHLVLKPSGERFTVFVYIYIYISEVKHSCGDPRYSPAPEWFPQTRIQFLCRWPAETKNRLSSDTRSIFQSNVASKWKSTWALLDNETELYSQRMEDVKLHADCAYLNWKWQVCSRATRALCAKWAPPHGKQFKVMVNQHSLFLQHGGWLLRSGAHPVSHWDD